MHISTAAGAGKQGSEACTPSASSVSRCLAAMAGDTMRRQGVLPEASRSAACAAVTKPSPTLQEIDKFQFVLGGLAQPSVA